MIYFPSSGRNAGTVFFVSPMTTAPSIQKPQNRNEPALRLFSIHIHFSSVRVRQCRTDPERNRPSRRSAALLSELGRRLKINFELVNIESSARTISLTSGVVDVVFWYLYGENYVITDMDNGIQLSAPYYDLDDWFYIEKK